MVAYFVLATGQNWSLETWPIGSRSMPPSVARTEVFGVQPAQQAPHFIDDEAIGITLEIRYLSKELIEGCG